MAAFAASLLGSIVLAYGGDAAPPKPFGPVPSERQLQWHEVELAGFLHFTVNTFTDREWGNGDEPESLFAPSDFDADQIVAALASAGMKEAILTCKHHDGFCLWPTKTTDHSVSKSPFRGGKGDVVRELADACRRRGLKFGVYLSPWDRNNAEYGHAAYPDLYRAQLRELLTNYAPIAEIWHDGANGGDGFYGGAREKREIDRRTYYDWPKTWQLARELAPLAVIFSDAGPDLRWVGNESGYAGETCWATYTPHGGNDSDRPSPGDTKYAEGESGHRDGRFWMPAEVDVSIRPGWFWHESENGKVKSPKELLDLYFASVGRGANLLLNVPPDRRGRIHEHDAASLQAFGDQLRALFADDLARGAVATASNVRGNDGRFAAANVNDGDRATYWATDDDVKQAELVLTFDAPRTFSVARVREAIELGQRVDAFALDADEHGTWRELAHATSIGPHRLLRLPVTTTRAVRLRITSAAACPAIRELALFAAPEDRPTAAPTAGPRYERVRDFLATYGEAEIELPAGASRVEPIGDLPRNTDDDLLELSVPIGTKLRFRDVAIHPGARLKWRVGPFKIVPTEPTTPVLCRISLEHADGSREELASASVDVLKEPRWPSGEIDLSARAGTRATFLFETEGRAPPNQRVSWSTLRLASNGRPELASDRTLELREVAADLAADPAIQKPTPGCIALPAPAVQEIQLKVPERAELRFFAGVAFTPNQAKSTKLSDEIGAQLIVSVDGQALFNHARLLKKVTDDPFGKELRLDLSAWSGRDVTLRFEARPLGTETGGVAAIFGAPRLFTRRRVERARRSSERPDLFLVIVDTLRADALGLYGCAHPTSPRLDRFAERAVVFDHAYSQCSWTLPSTATIHTGLHPDEHGLRDGGSAFLLDANETIAEALAQRGITSAAFVSNSIISPHSNFDQGFETFQELNWCNARKFVPRVLDWLDDHEADRVFVALHYVDPHSAYDAPLPKEEIFASPGNPYDGLSFDQLREQEGDIAAHEGPQGTMSAQLRNAVLRLRDLYDTEVRYWDRWFGVLLDGLAARGRLENAIFVITADHGEEFLEHGSLFHCDHLYEESVRVPLIVRAPGLQPGRLAEAIAGRQIKPLVLDLMGFGGKGTLDELVRAHFPESIHLATELGIDENSGRYVRREAVVRQRKKLIATPALEREELFDLASDPAEKNDLAAKDRRLLNALEDLLERGRQEHARAMHPSFIPVLDETVKRLRELGYIK